MIRNQTPSLIESKRRLRGGKYVPAKNIIFYQFWCEQYYRQQQTLQKINAANKNITIMTKKYEVNPSVYTLRQVQKLITDNCQLIQSVDSWIQNFKYSPPNTAMQKHQKALVSHTQTRLAEQVSCIFQNKQIISTVNNSLNQISFSLNPSLSNNLHISRKNKTNAQSQHQDRYNLFQEVTSKIQNLNSVMKRMNALVQSQGQLVNRIDENLLTGKQMMVKANQQLQTRTRKQQGTGEFSFQGKVNKVITGLYILNIFILVMFVLKHLIF